MNKGNPMKLRTLIALLVVPACLVGVAACGDDSSTDALSLKDPWSCVTAPGQTAGAVYLTIESKDGDTMTKASVPASDKALTLPGSISSAFSNMLSAFFFSVWRSFMMPRR